MLNWELSKGLRGLGSFFKYVLFAFRFTGYDFMGTLVGLLFSFKIFLFTFWSSCLLLVDEKCGVSPTISSTVEEVTGITFGYVSCFWD